MSRPESAEDRRFTLGLALDVAAVLTEHGYPPLSDGTDLIALQQALFAFLYRRAGASPEERRPSLSQTDK